MATLQQRIIRAAESTLDRPLPGQPRGRPRRRAADRLLYELWRWHVRAARDPKWPDLRQLIDPERAAWEEARRAAQGPIVLFTSTVGRSPLIPFEAVLGIALTLRGARVHFLLCDRTLPACENMSADRDPWRTAGDFAARGPDRRNVCWSCYQPARKFLADLGLPVWTYGAALDAVGAPEPEDQCVGPRHLEEHTVAGALRYYRRSTLPDEPSARDVMQRYAASASMSARVAERMLDRVQPAVVVSHHGMYVPQGIWMDACRVKGVRGVAWGMGSRRDTFVFSHGETFIKTLVTEPCDAWTEMPWTSERRLEIAEYLNSRRTGARDWKAFVNLPIIDDSHRIAESLGIDLTRPVYCLLTNVCWDAQLRFSGNAFSDQMEWIRFTLNWFARHPDLQLVIRVHPAEIQESLQRVTDEIHGVMADLPGNIKLIPPESRLSTLALGEMCNAVLIYATTAGIELAALGRHVIVAGEAWCRDKGFTIDVSNPEHYRAVLDELPLPDPLSAERHDRALRYAYHYFFRRLIEVRTPWRKGTPWKGLAHIRPGADSGLDAVCDGILHGASFIHERGAAADVRLPVAAGARPSG